VPYLDTSVVAAYYVPEPLSEKAQELYEAHDRISISDLVER
jgi:predicted nucleic acid-binding protein